MHDTTPARAVLAGLLKREEGGEVDVLYLNVRDAAKYVGIGEKAMRDYVNSSDPPPYLMNGNKVMLEKAALAPYFKGKQEVK